MMMGTSSGSSSSSNLFTAAQWEELEQQALIYKYMVSGVPVPTDLILSVRRSLYNCSFSSSSSLFSSSANQPTLGVWEGGFQYNQLYQIGGGGGYGRKIDLEPGRCRRTDGKKWRCSKEAYPDSKYCERHMHRGRNRSRKPVEFPSSSSSSSSTATSANVSSSASSSTTTLISKSVSPCDSYPLFSSDNNQNALHPHYSSSRPSGLSPTNNTIQNNFMDSSSYSHQTLKDYRYLQGMKDLGEDERSAYFQLNDPYTTQKMAAASSSDRHNYSHFNFQNLNDQFKEQQDKEDEAEGQHCFVMGTDFIKSSEEASKPRIRIDTKVDDTTHTNMANKQPFHYFFSPPKTTLNHDPAWVEVDQHHHLINPPKSPLSTQDLFQSKPRPYW